MLPACPCTSQREMQIQPMAMVHSSTLFGTLSKNPRVNKIFQKMICVRDAQSEVDEYATAIYRATGQGILMDLCHFVVRQYTDIEYKAFEMSLMRRFGIYDGYFFI